MGLVKAVRVGRREGDSGKGLALVAPILWDRRGAVLCGHSYVREVTIDGDSKDPTAPNPS